MTYSVDISDTVNVIIKTFFNYIIFFTTLVLLQSPKQTSHYLRLWSYPFFKILVLFSILQFLSGYFVSFDEAFRNELFGGMRPVLFFNESNWAGIFTFFFYLFVYYETKAGTFSKEVGNKAMYLMCLVLILDLSRITMALFALHTLFFKYGFEKHRVFVYVALGIGVMLFASSQFLYLLPERFTYDILDVDANPRLNDSTNLIAEILKYNKQEVGFGWGTLAFIADTYPWRNYGTSINVLPVQIYFDFGIVGAVLFSILYLFGIYRAHSFEKGFFLICLLVICSFHNPFYMNFFWAFMGIFCYQFSQFKTKNS